MSIVPINATLCAGPGPHRSLGGTLSAAEACPTCGGEGWYVTPRARAREFALTPEQAEGLLSVLEDLGVENVSTMHVASRAVYCPRHLDRDGLGMYADAIEKLAFAALVLRSQQRP